MTHVHPPIFSTKYFADLTQRVRFEAEQKVARAQAEAQALKLQNEQIAPRLIQLRQIEMMREKWNREFPNVMLGGSGLLPFMDVSTFGQEGKHEAPIVMIWSKVAPVPPGK